MPQFSDGAYAGETVTLSNDRVRLEVHKRPTGWGWGELFALDGDDETLVAVLEHLGEVDLGGFPHRLRLSADEYERTDTDSGQRLTFDVAVQDVSEAEAYMADESPLTGTVTIELRDDEPLVDLCYEVETQCQVELRYLRGPWLRIGADSFGTDRTDGIFPSVDWVEGDEHSSGTDYFEHDDALRLAPHPYKVGIPVMAVSGDGVAIGLSWEAESVALSSRANERCPQPVYASPNFVDRRDDSLVGLMVPSARSELEENDLRADPPVTVSGGSTYSFESTVSVVEGTSQDVVTDWVQRHGLPDPGEPRYDWGEVVEWLAGCYDDNLWVEGEGFGTDVGFSSGATPSVPDAVSWYVENGEDDDLVASLEEKVAWCEAQSPDDGSGGGPGDETSRPLGVALSREGEELAAFADALLDLQTEAGAFEYEPHGRHATDLEELSSHWRPLGQPGDTELGLCAPAAAALLLAGRETGDETYTEAGLETLEFAERFTKPAGDDWWETPLHGPNLYAGGKAAIAYYLGYEETGEEAYRQQAIRWLRSLLPFTHLWEPHDRETLYNTKPCLVSTAWYLSDWVSRFVQWEVLSVFNYSDDLGIDWNEIDPAIDWDRYRRGVSTAALRWIIDARDSDLLYEFQFPHEEIESGEWDGLWADTYDPVEGVYAGGPLTPGNIGASAIALLDR